MIAIVAGLMSAHTHSPLLAHSTALFYYFVGMAVAGSRLDSSLSHFCWAFITGWKILRRPSFANCCLRHAATRRSAQRTLWAARGDEHSLPAPRGQKWDGKFSFSPDLCVQEIRLSPLWIRFWRPRFLPLRHWPCTHCASSTKTLDFNASKVLNDLLEWKVCKISGTQQSKTWIMQKHLAKFISSILPWEFHHPEWR
jgi:hypothetical protein